MPLIVDYHKRADASANPTPGDQGALLVGGRQNGDKLLASETPNDVELADGTGNLPRDRGENLVAISVAVRDVDVLELVDVAIQDSQRADEAKSVLRDAPHPRL